MSIYIHGMEMPKSCPECFADDNGWCNILGCSIGNSVALRMIERRRDCPLVEVPPHGDLIDRTEIKRQWYETSLGSLVVDVAEIDAAKTIIPADPEGGIEG